MKAKWYQLGKTAQYSCVGLALLVGVFLIYWVQSDKSTTEVDMASAVDPYYKVDAAGDKDKHGFMIFNNRSPAQFASDQDRALWIMNESALRGTQVQGAMQVDSNGHLLRTIQLRALFSYYLQLVGQMPLAEIDKHIQWLAEKNLPPTAQKELQDIWKKYLALESRPVRETFALDDVASIERALRSQSKVREEALGAEWARVFYAQEESETLTALSSAASGVTSSLPQTGVLAQIDLKALTPEAAKRLQGEEQAISAWNEKVNKASLFSKQAMANPAWSATQKTEAIEAYLAQHFPVTEHARVRGLLGQTL